MAINPLTGKEENPADLGSVSGNIQDTTLRTPDLGVPLNFGNTTKSTTSVTGSIPKPVTPTVTTTVTQPTTVEKTPDLGVPLNFNNVQTKPTGTTASVPTVTVPKPTEVIPTNPAEQAAANEIKKINEQSQENVNDIYKNFNLVRGNYETNKGYYSNFDELNNKANKAFDLLQYAQNQAGNRILTDAEYQNIANQAGLTIDQVKDPNKIWDTLAMTDEGKRKLGITKSEQGIQDYTTAFERNKADLQTKIDQTAQNYQYQIDDATKQMNDTLSWMTASGVWSGADKSSAYKQGMANVQSEGQKTIDRLKTASDQASGALHTDLSRVTEDYNTGIERANQELKDNISAINQDLGNKLNVLSTKYDLGSPYLSKLLDEEMNKASNLRLEAIGKAQDMILKQNQETRTQTDYMIQLNDTMDKLANKKYEDLLANNGAILQNTSLTTLTDLLHNGDITADKYQSLMSIMQSSIQNVLGKQANLTSSDMSSINSLLKSGMTPAEVIGKMQEMDKFQTAESKFKQNFTDVGNGMYYDKVNNKLITQDEMMRQFNQASTPISSTGTVNTQSVINYSLAKRHPKGDSQNLQCGELVNDYWQQATGQRIGMGNSFDSKVQAVMNNGATKTPTVGGVFVLDGGKFGHTGIVTAVNADGSIEVLEANRENSVNGGTPTTGTYSADQVKRMLFSQAPQQKATTGTNATSLIGKWEGFKDEAYQDSTGKWTIGYGFTSINGRPVHPGDTITQADADARLQQEISNRQNFMNYITVPLNENQKAALSSFEYNLGSGIWQKGAMDILDKINAGDLNGAAAEMKQYNNAGGKPVQGLTNRRNEEASLLLSSAPATTSANYNPNLTDLYNSKTLPGAEVLKGLNLNMEQFLAQKKAYQESQGVSDIDYFSQLDSAQKTLTKTLAKTLFGTKEAQKTESLNMIAEQLLAGKTKDEINDMLRTSGYGQSFQGDVKNAFVTVTQKMTANQIENNQAQLEDLVGQYGEKSTQVRDFFKRLARDNAGATVSQSIMGKETLIKQLGNIQTELEKYQAKGGDTGIFTGKANEIANKVGKMTDKDLQKIAKEIQINIQNYRKAISGAAFSESEAKEYQDIFPSVSSDMGVNVANIQAIRDTTKSELDSFYGQNLGEEAYNNIAKQNYGHGKGTVEYKDGTKIEFDGNGKYRYFKEGNWSKWTNEGTSLPKTSSNTQKSSINETLGVMGAFGNETPKYGPVAPKSNFSFY